MPRVDGRIFCAIPCVEYQPGAEAREALASDGGLARRIPGEL